MENMFEQIRDLLNEIEDANETGKGNEVEDIKSKLKKVRDNLAALEDTVNSKTV